MESIIRFFERALNHYLSLDPESNRHMDTLRDKRVKIELLDFPLVFTLVFTEKGVVIATDDKIKPNATIKGTPLSLIRVAITRGDRKKFFKDDVAIQGDAELGQQVVDLFDQLDIDWEEYLSKKIGDVPAHHLGKIVRGVKRWLVDSSDAFKNDLTDYLHDEKSWFPQQELLQEFYNNVDALRLDVDRLEAKIAAYKKNLS